MSDIVKFNQFLSSAPARIEAAQTTEEVKQVVTEAKVLAAAARAARNKEYEELAKDIEAKALTRLGQMMATQRDAGMLNTGARTAGTKRGTTRGTSNPASLADAGIDKNLAKAARKAYPQGWPKTTKPPKVGPTAPRMTPGELEAEGRSPKTELYATPAGPKSRIKIFRDELVEAKERIAELEKERDQWRRDFEALQKDKLFQLSQAALASRKHAVAQQNAKRAAKAETEIVPDVKTVADYERRLKALQTQLHNEKAKARARDAQRNVIAVISNADRKFLLTLLHPDRASDPAEKTKLERGFKIIGAIPELLETAAE